MSLYYDIEMSNAGLSDVISLFAESNGRPRPFKAALTRENVQKETIVTSAPG